MKSPIPEKFKKSLDASWKEGIPANMMMVVMDYYLVPFGLFLGASPSEIGLLVAVPHLLGSISQLIAARIVKVVGSRLRFLIRSSCLQAAMLIPLGLMSFLPLNGKVYALIFFASGFRILNNLIGTVWGSLVSEYLEPHQRGRYFGWRSQIAALAGLVGLAVAGSLLYLAKKFSLSTGFFLLFCLISICRFLSAYLFTKMDDLAYHDRPESHFTFWDFIAQFRKSNFVRFTLYVAAISFSTQLASPYFSVHMLNNLKFDYILYMIIHMAAVISGMISFPIWGRHADHTGNAKILRITSFLVPVIPLLWVFSNNPYYLFVVEFLAGFIWGGFNLASSNYIYDAVTPQKRVRCLGYFNLIHGIAIFCGASLGGWLAEHLPALFGYRLLSLFLISALLRFTAHFILSGGFQEVRKQVRPVSSSDLFFSVIGLRPMSGRNREWFVSSSPGRTE